MTELWEVCSTLFTLAQYLIISEATCLTILLFPKNFVRNSIRECPLLALLALLNLSVLKVTEWDLVF